MGKTTTTWPPPPTGGTMPPWGPRRRRPARAAARAGWRTSRWTARKGWKHRARLAPVYWAAGLTAVAEACHWAGNGGRSMAAFSILSGLLTAGWLYLRQHPTELAWIPRRDKASPRRVKKIVGLWVASALWGTVAGWAGVSRDNHTLGALVVGVGILGGVYWWDRRIRKVPPPPVEVADPEPVLDPRIVEWHTYVGGGKLATGSVMHTITPLMHPLEPGREIGWQAVIRAAKGTEFSKLSPHIGGIAGVYDLTAGDVSLVSTPAAGGSRGGLFLVYTDNPLHETQPYAGPDTELLITKGIVRVGGRGSGQPAHVRYVQPRSGAIHELVSGVSGSGKSGYLDARLADEQACPRIASLVIDPQDGQSLPAWRTRVAHYADNPTDGMELLECMYHEMRARSRRLANLPWTTPAGQDVIGVGYYDWNMPEIMAEDLLLYSLTVEEAPAMLVDPRAAYLVLQLLLRGRKCGIRVRVVTQSPLLDQLGNSTPLREQLISGNVVLFRTASKLSAQVTTPDGFVVDPTNLPREWPNGEPTAGLCYVLGPGASEETARADYVADPYAIAYNGQVTPAPEIETTLRAMRIYKQQQEAAAGQKADGVPAAGKAIDRIETYINNHGKPIVNTVIAERLGIPIGTVNESCRRLAKGGKIRKVEDRPGMWCPLSYDPEAAEHDDDRQAA